MAVGAGCPVVPAAITDIAASPTAPVRVDQAGSCTLSSYCTARHTTSRITGRPDLAGPGTAGTANKDGGRGLSAMIDGGRLVAILADEDH